MQEAHNEASLVRGKVLFKLRPHLADAFGDFVNVTRLIAKNVSNKGSRENIETWRRWSQWWQKNRSDIRLPQRAKI
jgi:hypothetical protein